MKKIFTILAAALFSVSMMAQTTVFNWSPTEAECVGTVFFGHSEYTVGSVKIHTNTDNITALKLNTGYSYADKKYLSIKPANGSFKAGDIVSLSVCFNNSDESKKAIVDIYSPDGQTKLYSTPQGVNGKTSADAPTVVTYTLEADADSLILGRGGNTATYVPTLFVTHPAPVANPVTSVTIDGVSECFVDRKITLVATTDVTADDYKWAVDGVEQAESNSKRFEFTPTAAATYSIVCYAKNAHNADWVASAAHSLVATVKEVLTQVDVTESTTWDWTKASAKSEIKLTDSTTPAKGDTVLLANVDDFNNDANFNAQAILFAGEYPVRDGKYCQGSLLKFHTTVAGTLEVIYSNTGNRSEEDDRRFLVVNDVVVGEGSMKSNETVTESNISVPAGDVVITGQLKKDGSVQYLRFYKVVFTKSTGTAVDNITTVEKTLKMVENGQLIIIKNGVKYNAQGVAVK